MSSTDISVLRGPLMNWTTKRSLFSQQGQKAYHLRRSQTRSQSLVTSGESQPTEVREPTIAHPIRKYHRRIPPRMGMTLIKGGKVVATYQKIVKKKKHHINYLELKAVLTALQAFKGIQGIIKVSLDNTCAAAYIKRSNGRTRKLEQLARRIFFAAKDRGIPLVSEYIKGNDNILADRLSRIENHTLKINNLNNESYLFPTFHALPTFNAITVAKVQNSTDHTMVANCTVVPELCRSRFFASHKATAELFLSFWDRRSHDCEQTERS